MNKLFISGTLVALFVLTAPGRLAAQAQPKGSLEGMTAPKPNVPVIFTLTGQYVRLAYNNEGYAVLGYRMAEQEVGNPWMLLSVGVTLMEGAKDQKLMRDAFSLQTPDGTTIPLPTQTEYMKADVRAVNKRAQMFNDSINYFPVGGNRPCAMQFFANLENSRSLAFDYIELTSERDCLGRLYFNVPGGIQVGQYFLNVKFAGSSIQVPFRIFTKEQAKDFAKQWQDLKKTLDESFK